MPPPGGVGVWGVGGSPRRAGLAKVLGDPRGGGVGGGRGVEGRYRVGGLDQVAGPADNTPLSHAYCDTDALSVQYLYARGGAASPCNATTNNIHDFFGNGVQTTLKINIGRNFDVEHVITVHHLPRLKGQNRRDRQPCGVPPLNELHVFNATMEVPRSHASWFIFVMTTCENLNHPHVLTLASFQHTSPCVTKCTGGV